MTPIRASGRRIGPPRFAVIAAATALCGWLAPATALAEEGEPYDLRALAPAAESEADAPVSNDDALWLSLAFAIDDFRSGALDAQAEKGTGAQTPADEIAMLRAEVAALQTALAEAERQKESLTYRLSLWTMTDISAAEDVIARTGLDTDLLLLRLAESNSVLGQGGPYVPADGPVDGNGDDASLLALDTHVGRWDGLRQLLLQLPLAEPMDEFRTTSHFGERVDPINGRRAAHAGLDFAGPMRSTVRVTAPGIVVHADWKGGYGRLVEVDHGMGITTRYAHLSSILVEVGDTVAYRTPVGLLGSSGRSTGPHLHYEIRLDGEPMDPSPFVDAGRYVFKAMY